MGHALNKILKDIINRYKVWFSTYFRYKLLPIFFDGFSSRLAWCLMDITELICPPDCILRTYWVKDIGNMSWMRVIIIVVAFCFIPMPFGLQGLGTPGILVWYSGMLLLMWFTWWRLERVVIWISERRKSQTAAGLLLRLILPNLMNFVVAWISWKMTILGRHYSLLGLIDSQRHEVCASTLSANTWTTVWSNTWTTVWNGTDS